MKQTISKAKWQCTQCEATYVVAVNRFWEEQDDWPCSCGGRVHKRAQLKGDLAMVRRLRGELANERSAHEAAVAMASRICGDASWNLSHAIEAMASGDKEAAILLIEEARRKMTIVATSAELKAALES